MKLHRIDTRRVFVITGLIALIIIYAILWLRMIKSPAERTGSDFIAFYAAGRIAHLGNWANVFNPQTQIIQEEQVLGFSILPNDLNPFVHPPFLLPILAAVSSLRYIEAFHAWAGVMLIFYILGAWTLPRVIPHVENRKILFASVILFFPAFVSMLNGQDSALLLLGAAVWLYGLSTDNDRLAGIGLALTTIRPHIALLLALPFLFKRRKVLFWFMGSAALLAAFSVILTGIQGTQNFLHILSISASGEGYKISENAMLNFLGMLQRLFPDTASGIIRLVGWIFYGCSAFFLCILWIRSKQITEKHIGLASLLALFAVPHLHYHDLVLLLIPVFCLISLLTKRGTLNGKTISLLPLEISWLLVFSNALPVLKYSVPYLLGLLLGIALWIPGIVSQRKKNAL